MSERDLIGVGLFVAAAVYGYRAYQQYQGQGGAVQIAPAPQPVAPNAYAPSGSVDLSWLSSLFDWPSFVPAANASTAPLPSNNFGVSMTVSNDILTLARTIYGEARSETQAGKEAVASVILNRVRSPRWPSSIAAVCLQPWQFSCWNANDPNRNMIKDLQPGANALFDSCLEIARRAANGQLQDNTGGATHYFASYIATPSWVTNSPNAVRSAQYGVHQFYRGIA